MIINEYILHIVLIKPGKIQLVGENRKKWHGPHILHTHLLFRLAIGHSAKWALNNKGRYFVFGLAGHLVLDRRLSENSEDFSQAAATDPDLLSVQDPVLAVWWQLSSGPDRRGVRAAGGLGQCESSDYLAGGESWQVFGFLGVVAGDYDAFESDGLETSQLVECDFEG